ncbi:MAG: DNA polymerase III subunit beta [Deltaproteobacteria bacterium]|nr:DNA polymerase III subunit beta [Deltaproteobacteria bacterium]
MKFMISRDDLYRIASRLRGIPARASSMPVLTHVHLMTKRGELFITATDLEVLVRVTTETEVFDEGSIAIPADPFFKIIRKMPDENISFETGANNRIKVSGGNARFNLAGLAGEDFPQFPELDMKETLSIPSNTLQSMLEKTLFAVSRNEGMARLCGVFAVIRGNNGSNTFCMVGTDGHRLAKMETPAYQTVTVLQDGILIPLKGGIELLRMAREADGNVELRIDKNNLSSSLPGETLIIRLLNGQFPDYRAVTDNTGGVPVLTDRESLIECLERIHVMARDQTSHVSLSLKETDVMEMKTFNHDLGDAEDRVPVRTDLKEISVGFNAGYLLEGLKVMKSRNLDILLKDARSPAFIKGEEDEGFTYVVMPMRA